MNISVIVEYTGVFLILIGGIMAVISAIGLLRLPDVYTRSHAATKSSTLAVLLSLTGTFLYFWATENFISVRLVLGIIFVFLTAPVSGHLITRAAYRSHVKLSESSTEDALKDVLFNTETDK
ncbi:Na+/H+ antiporter subunit G [Planococcus sp. N028]|uniref:Na+/H+ antiporter subunit G n=1 Tax=Planococcus shixiaomingii TaxID=3058393 RepID=A0ABT8N2H2_9BACL|nr:MULTISPECIES: Na+/H+ antiporter subunit G [unclassified Planococcus (in: firmicutes)]MDN7242081.1 Na+/H+ antiporter subunit G [Planococcus sp. N028]WKA54355.1 Na+/H+ antiporter subunit G [Planococcus sp. N022]